MSDVASFCGKDGGGATQLGIFPLLACNSVVPIKTVYCNSLILVVCCLIFGAREADSRAELTLRGVRRERGLLVCDTYSARLRLCLADPGRHRSVTCIGCLPGTQEVAGPCVSELASLHPGPWAV